MSEMKIDVDLLLQEYFLSHDVDEAARCVKQFNSPHFYHEVVKRAITNSFDKSASTRDVAHALLLHLFREDIVSPGQMSLGFQLVHARLPDIVLDTPTASTLFQEAVSKAKADGILSADVSF